MLIVMLQPYRIFRHHFTTVADCVLICAGQGGFPEPLTPEQQHQVRNSLCVYPVATYFRPCLGCRLRLVERKSNRRIFSANSFCVFASFQRLLGSGTGAAIVRQRIGDEALAAAV